MGKGRKPLWRRRCRLVHNIVVDLGEIGGDGMARLVRLRIQSSRWLFYKMLGISYVVAELVASRKALSSKEFVLTSQVLNGNTQP
jgi:hypothetical protein